jgi:RNA polymerase sigma factor (sigma-70 family)
MEQKQITLGELERKPKLLNQFIEENTRPMIQYCVRNFAKINEEDAEDIVQDAFEELIKIVTNVTQREVKKKDTPAIAWMYKVLRWRCIDIMRIKEREEGKMISDEEAKNIPGPTPIEGPEDNPIYQFLRECIETRMKGRRREIFELYLEGYIAAEIARKLDVTKPYITKETKIGHRLLRKWLTECGFDWDSIKVYFL